MSTLALGRFLTFRLLLSMHYLSNSKLQDIQNIDGPGSPIAILAGQTTLRLNMLAM
jgi:hypothetical protein